MEHYGSQIPRSVLLQVKKETEEWAGFTGIDLTASNTPYFEEMMTKAGDQNHRLRTPSAVSVKNRDLETKRAAIQEERKDDENRRR